MYNKLGMFKILPIACLILTSACSTMHFTQDISAKRITSDKTISKWHNTTLNGMVEISQPVNLYKECLAQPWQRVTVEYGAKEGLTSAIVDSVVDIIIPALSFVNLYAPWEVEVHCTQPKANSPLKLE